MRGEGGIFHVTWTPDLEQFFQVVVVAKVRPFFSPKVSHFLKVRTRWAFPAHFGERVQ